jgi:hypothetical protein
MTEAHSGAAVRPDRPQQRNLDYLQPQRDAQRRIKTALHAYVALEQRVEQIHTAAHNDINQIRQQQAIVVWQISHTGRTVQQIAELLDISQADTWQLLSTGRTAAAHATPTRPATTPSPSPVASPTRHAIKRTTHPKPGRCSPTPHGPSSDPTHHTPQRRCT